ncbi:MAG: UDP-N-acetylglucosamine 2-epimerase (non-hydrolyzing) [Candidatus Eisenbacteria bacterium]
MTGRKIVSVVGARPQFVKAAALSRRLRERFREVLVHTGQHYDVELSDLFFEELHIPRPDFTLGVGSKSHARQTGEMMEKLEDLLAADAPDFVLIYGDTNSTLAGALAAAKLNLRIAHVEAGLRCFDLGTPEEVNRVVADRLSTILFAPTATAVDNLKREGITSGVFLVGDVMVDALLGQAELARSRSRILQDLKLSPKEYIVVTIHRPANTDNPESLARVVEILMKVPSRVVFPVHPRTREALRRQGFLEKLAGAAHILLLSPVGYLDMLSLQTGARAVVTDSGGMQKEAYLLGVPCITLREETEWVETVEDGWNILVGTDVLSALSAIETLEPAKPRSDWFGRGDASEKITDVLVRFLEAP